MKKLWLGLIIGITLLSSCSSRNTYESTGADNTRYKGQYYGNRPRGDIDGFESQTSVGGGYGWQRDY